MTDFLKLFGPILLFTFFIFKLKDKPPYKLFISMLFFTSISAFSQNFTFYYREIHQLIQLFIVINTILIVIRNKSVNIVSIPLMIFLIFITISILNSGLDLDSTAQLVNFIVVIFVVMFLFNSLEGEGSKEKLLAFIGGLGIVLANLTIFEFLLKGVARAEATFANPNYLALFLGISFSLVFYFHGKSKIITLPLIIFAIILTGSRSAILIPLMVMGWNIFTGELNYKKVFVLVCCVLSSIVFLNSSSNRFNSDGLSASDAERLLFTKIGYKMAVDNPLNGVGWGRFITEFSNYSGSLKAIKLNDGEVDVSKQDRRVSHNDLLRIGAELGLVALFFVLLFMLKTIYFLLVKRAYGLDYIVPIWFGLLVFSLTHNNLNTAFSWFFFLMPYFIFKSNRAK